MWWVQRKLTGFDILGLTSSPSCGRHWITPKNKFTYFLQFCQQALSWFENEHLDSNCVQVQPFTVAFPSDESWTWLTCSCATEPINYRRQLLCSISTSHLAERGCCIRVAGLVTSPATLTKASLVQSSGCVMVRRWQRGCVWDPPSPWGQALLLERTVGDFYTLQRDRPQMSVHMIPSLLQRRRRTLSISLCLSVLVGLKWTEATPGQTNHVNNNTAGYGLCCVKPPLMSLDVCLH